MRPSNACQPSALDLFIFSNQFSPSVSTSVQDLLELSSIVQYVMHICMHARFLRRLSDMCMPLAQLSSHYLVHNAPQMSSVACVVLPGMPMNFASEQMNIWMFSSVDSMPQVT